MHDALISEIKPAGILEQIYVKDVADLTWEICRVRRFKSALQNTAFLSALESVFRELLKAIGNTHEYTSQTAQDNARKWFTNKRARQ